MDQRALDGALRAAFRAGYERAEWDDYNRGQEPPDEDAYLAGALENGGLDERGCLITTGRRV